MIESVTVTNYLGDKITLMLARPDISGFLITNIEGLGPVSASINTTKVATSDGSIYNSARLDERNITMSLIFLDDNGVSVEKLRHRSYKYFPIKRKVHLSIKTDERVLETDGYVETNEPIIFSSKVSTSISILCPDPFFYSPRYDNTNFSNEHPAFEFPFGEENDPVEFDISTYDKTTETTIRYEGDHEVGVSMTINFTGEAERLMISNKMTGETMVLDNTRLGKVLGGDLKFKPGDIIQINTQRRNKSITFTRDGVTSNILNCLARGTKWFTLSRGDNIFYFTAALDGEHDKGTNNVRMVLKNKIIYDGV